MTTASGKVCFVTVGATAAFKELIRGVLEPPFLSALKAAGYGQLIVQYGNDGHLVFQDSLAALGHSDSIEPVTISGITISGFDFRQDGLVKEMAMAKNWKGAEGVVVSHAGSGTILAALRMDVPLIVVPNSSLLDNHQLELAEELAKQGYVVQGQLDKLPTSVEQAEELRRRKQAWPSRDTVCDPSGRGLMGVLDDEMGFVD